MNSSISKYRIDGQKMDEYLKSRFKSASITFSIIATIVLSILTIILYKRHALKGLWSYLISIPVMIGAFVFSVKKWNNDLLNLTDTEYILTTNSLIQKTPNQIEKKINFLEIAVLNKKKFGTTIIKGNWLTKIDYYRPKKSAHHFDNPNHIFIPSITTNYLELIDIIEKAKRLQ